MVSTQEDCLAFVNDVGLCTWRHYPKIPCLPSLELATGWRGAEVTGQTWFWKDDLHIERRLYFGMLIAPDIPAFASLSFLPYLMAAQGDIDPRSLHEKGLLPSNSLKVYEYIERSGPTATSAIPFAAGSRMLYLAHLQQKFLLTKHDLTGRTRGKYGYRWCLCEEAFADSFAAAARIDVAGARRQVAETLSRHCSEMTTERAGQLFRWQPL